MSSVTAVRRVVHPFDWPEAASLLLEQATNMASEDAAYSHDAGMRSFDLSLAKPVVNKPGLDVCWVGTSVKRKGRTLGSPGKETRSTRLLASSRWQAFKVPGDVFKRHVLVAKASATDN